MDGAEEKRESNARVSLSQCREKLSTTSWFGRAKFYARVAELVGRAPPLTARPIDARVSVDIFPNECWPDTGMSVSAFGRPSLTS